MKSELFIKMTASVVTFSLAVGYFGSVAIADSGDKVDEKVVLESEKAMAGLEFAMSSMGKDEQLKYIDLVSNLIKDKEITSEEKAVGTNDDNKDKVNEAKELKKEKKEEKKEKKKEKYAGMCVVKVDAYINVRKEARKDANILGKMYNGSVAKIIKTDGNWYKISSGGIEGYVIKDYIITGLSDEELIKKYGIVTAKVKADILNIRESANKDANVIAKSNEGSILKVIHEYDDWVEVKKDNVTGFVSKEYVSISIEFESAIPINLEKETTKERERKTNTSSLKSTSKDSKETSEKTTGTIISATDNEIKYMAALVYAEAGSEPYTGKIGVVNVLINRVMSGNFPNSFIGVITQSGQFSPYRTGKLSREIGYYESGKYSSDSLRSDCVKAVKAALNGKNVVGSRCYFNGAAVESRKGHKNSMVIGSHMFW